MFMNLQKMQCNVGNVNSNADLSEELEKIASDKGFVISDNEGSGNCMFHALSEQLNLLKGIKISHGELRQSIVRYLRNNPKLPDGTHLYNFTNGYKSWADYLTKMKQDGTWGDHVILYATANHYETYIQVISSLSNYHDLTIRPDGDVISTNPLVLGHVHEVFYVSLTPKQGTAFTEEEEEEEEEKEEEAVDASFIVKATEQFEAEHAECVRVCPYFKDGKVMVHLYVYSSESGIPTALKTAAREFFGEMGLELEWSDLYNDSYNVLNVTPIEYPSGKPKRLEAHQVDEIDEIINKYLHDVFSKHRNITGLQPSFKVTKSVQTEQACITVYVLGKGRIPVGESAIPSTVGPYPVDVVNGFFVRTKRPTKPIEAQKQQKVLCLGASIGIDGEQSSGTLGAIVEDENSGILYALSNKHVMKHPDKSEIIHPGLDVYLNYLHYHLAEYKSWISRILESEAQLPQISDEVLQERQTLSNTFDELKKIKEQRVKQIKEKHSASSEIPEKTWTKISEHEETFDKGFQEPPKTIANYSAGIRCNVVSATTNLEHFIDAGISQLKEDEAEKLKRNRTIGIIETGYYPSGECIPATLAYRVKEMFKSGSGTGYTESSCGLFGASMCPSMTIKGLREHGETGWVDVDCTECRKKKATQSTDQGSQSQLQALSSPCELCKSDRWMKRCLCIGPQRFQPFSDHGDSGVVVFEIRNNETAHPAFGIIFGIFPTQYHVFSLASPLEIAIEELSKKVSSSRPQGSPPCKLRLASSVM